MYAVTYDLLGRKNYPRIINQLIRMGGKRIALSVWIVPSRLPTHDLRNWLMNFMDDDDRLVVIPFVQRPFTLNAMPEGLHALNQV